MGLVIGLSYGRESQKREMYTDCSIVKSLSNKMDNYLLAVRNIRHKCYKEGGLGL